MYVWLLHVLEQLLKRQNTRCYEFSYSVLHLNHVYEVNNSKIKYHRQLLHEDTYMYTKYTYIVFSTNLP